MNKRQGLWRIWVVLWVLWALTLGVLGLWMISDGAWTLGLPTIAIGLLLPGLIWTVGNWVYRGFHPDH